MKYIRKAPDYEREKKYIMLMLGYNSKCAEKMDLLEKITNSLSLR